ncbi:MAG: hypothetical protein BAJATHORv1_80016 [Candidatus Thorarchaeota archaeon]|nr:MAG: hypothetical protein BAJATHORv1_80016 [Candidatus Thorarchaeota archaeon]
MSVPKVYFSDRKTSAHYNMLDKLEHVFQELGLSEHIQEGDKVMIKTHMGLYGNTNYIRPAYVRKLVELVKQAGGFPFVADTCSLGYGTSRPYGGRTTAQDYYTRAELNGFSQATVGAPIILADGYWGSDFLDVSISGDFITSVPVPSAVFDCDKVIILSHSKFHHIGIASALKNMGVGLVAKKGKTAVHSPNGLEIYPEKCLGSECSECLSVCPVRCITVANTVTIDIDRCIQCGHCSAICTSNVEAGALKVTWAGVNMAEKIVENTLGVMESIGRDRFYFINLAMDISDMCDCVCYAAPLLMHDLGIFGSRDPVAIDAATADAMKKAMPNKANPNSERIATLVDKSSVFFEHSEKIGLGSKKFDLVFLSRSE